MKNFIFAILYLLACQPYYAQAKPSQSIPLNSRSRSVTGKYIIKDKSSLDVLVLPDGRIKFHLFASYTPARNPGATRVGEAEGVVPLQGNTAVYETNEPDCKITMKFMSNRVTVSQEGGCGFGVNVTANGTYIKRSNQVPKFDS